jgi:hypothetical protein
MSYQISTGQSQSFEVVRQGFQQVDGLPFSEILSEDRSNGLRGTRDAVRSGGGRRLHACSHLVGLSLASHPVRRAAILRCGRRGFAETALQAVLYLAILPLPRDVVG